MKFVSSELLLRFVLLIYFISDVTDTQLTEYSDDKALTTVTHTSSLSPIIISTENIGNVRKSTKRNKSLLKRRRRRRKKKNPNIHQDITTAIPSFELSTIATTISNSKDVFVVNKTLRRRKHKRRKKGRNRKRKGHMKSTTAQSTNRKGPPLPLESKNLVLPITPAYTLRSFSKLSTTTMKAFQKRKKTRCSKNNGGCAHICHTKGSEKCSCFKGFTLVNNQHSCIDTNECLADNGGCEINCTNTVGSYQCHCPHGLRLSVDSKSCEDVNECLLRNGHGPCQDTCENTHGGYKCRCTRLKGTKLGNDLHSCVDVDECAKENGGCSHICINTFGRSFCSCPAGMELSEDLKMCQDVNECENEDINQNCRNGCINTEGSYRCASISDLQNDESHKEIVCKPLFPPKIGYFKCSRKHALRTFAKSGRKRIKNSLGTKCILMCPEGYKRRGQKIRVNCAYGGKWTGNIDAQCVPV